MKPEFPIRELGTLLRNHFGGRVQKISLVPDGSCRHRESASGGCRYCNPQAFLPAWCRSGVPLAEQWREGCAYALQRYGADRFLATFPMTGGSEGETHDLLTTCLSLPGLVGMVIACRPDRVTPELLACLAERQKNLFVLLEIGLESTVDATLTAMNRGHSWEEARAAVIRAHEGGIFVGGHLILGLPGEDATTLVSHADRLSALPLTALKLHHFQILRGTPLAEEYAARPEGFSLLSVEDYQQLLAAFLPRLRPEIAVDRLLNRVPPHWLIAPRWGGISPAAFRERLWTTLRRQGTWQGCLVPGATRGSEPREPPIPPCRTPRDLV